MYFVFFEQMLENFGLQICSILFLHGSKKKKRLLFYIVFSNLTRYKKVSLCYNGKIWRITLF